MAGVGYVAPVIQPNYVNNASGVGIASNDNTANTFPLIAAIEEAETLSSFDQDDSTIAANALSDSSALNESLLSNLNGQALLALNDVANNNNVGVSPTANFGILTTGQLQEMATLQNDIQFLALNQTNANTGITINDNGTTVNLSPEALDLLAEFTAENNISAANALSPAQVQQATAIVAPFLGAPLTPTVLTQIDTALAAVGITPQQISLQNLFLTMNYVAAEMETATIPAETVAMNEMITEMEEA